jgi:nicotinamidase-related amidase
MNHFDVFNGDADGICALHQLRLAHPRGSVLVSGVKRDIALLERVDAAPGDRVTVLDVSLDRNRAALLRLLGLGVHVEYFDHHFAGEIPRHPSLTAHIDPAPSVCTSTLVDRHLQGRHRLWDIVAAFGDNLGATAWALAAACRLGEPDAVRLRELGQAINYNGYGDTEADLLLPPVALYRALAPYVSPFDFMDREPTAGLLVAARSRDMALAHGTPAVHQGRAGTVYVLPDAAWARRVQGEFANELAQLAPGSAHAVLCEVAGGYRASVRAPIARPGGADTVCRGCATGGGRSAAAGIDVLPRQRLPEFVLAFEQSFAGGEVAAAGDARSRPHGQGQIMQGKLDSMAIVTGDALVVVDVQQDFLPGGALAVHGGAEVVPVLNDYLRRFAQAGLPVFATRDWHPPLHCSFRDAGGPWPTHCVAGTPGAAFAPGLALPPLAVVISKAQDRREDAYSAFAGTDLADRLRAAGARRLFVGGLATDYCVLHTVLDARACGFDVLLLTDAVRAVDASPGDGAAAIARMQEQGARLARLDDLGGPLAPASSTPPPRSS